MDPWSLSKASEDFDFYGCCKPQKTGGCTLLRALTWFHSRILPSLEFLSVRPWLPTSFQVMLKTSSAASIPVFVAFLLSSPRCANSPCSHYALRMPLVLGTEWPLLFPFFAHSYSLLKVRGRSILCSLMPEESVKYYLYCLNTSEAHVQTYYNSTALI